MAREFAALNFSVPSNLGSNLLHHPHSHCVVPGGGLSSDGTQWISCRPRFFLAVRVLSRLFRRLFLKYLIKAFDTGKLQFFSSLEPLRERRAFLRHLGSHFRHQMGGLRQAPFRRTRAGVGLCRSLYASRVRV
jgi:hypothetical protein